LLKAAKAAAWFTTPEVPEALEPGGAKGGSPEAKAATGLLNKAEAFGCVAAI